MMLITRTESRIEFEIGESQSSSIEVDRLTGVMLVARRAPCGRIFHALMLLVDGDTDPIRIEGSPFELTEIHQYVVETMLHNSARPTAH